ncbi:unnamed protein product, partial [Closterium sp. NIES-53]
YALDVNTERAEDVLTHKRLLEEAAKMPSQPVVHVRAVRVTSALPGGADGVAGGGGTMETDEAAAEFKRQGMLAPPAFGSSPNLDSPVLAGGAMCTGAGGGVGGGGIPEGAAVNADGHSDGKGSFSLLWKPILYSSLLLLPSYRLIPVLNLQCHSLIALYSSHVTSPPHPLPPVSSPSFPSSGLSIPALLLRFFPPPSPPSSPLPSPPSSLPPPCASSLLQVPMHEVTFSTVDRPKLLSQLSAVLADVGLNIREAHVFSTSDGLSLDVFVVDGWPSEDVVEMRAALMRAAQRNSETSPSPSYCAATCAARHLCNNSHSPPLPRPSFPYVLFVSCCPSSPFHQQAGENGAQSTLPEASGQSNPAMSESTGAPMSTSAATAAAAGHVAASSLSGADSRVRIPSDGRDDWEIDNDQLKLQHKIASGSFGDLYRGTYCGQDVAIKILKAERLNDSLQQEFAQEVFIMRCVGGEREGEWGEGGRVERVS